MKEETNPLSGHSIPLEYRLVRCPVCDGEGRMQKRDSDFIRLCLQMVVAMIEGARKSKWWSLL